MIACPTVRKQDIRSHYNLTTLFYRLLWGRHIHHGLWSGDESATVAQQQLTETLAREARIMRQQSMTLATAAAALLEPEDHAAKSLVRLGRAVRREVDVFNAALEAALGRMTMIEVSTNDRLASLENRTGLAVSYGPNCAHCWNFWIQFSPASR